VIAYLQGNVIPQDNDSVIINVRGVGYELMVSAATMTALSGLMSAQVWVYTHVREDIIQLFGFATKAEKEMFLSLIKVSGIGPKVALKILSGVDLGALMNMIEHGDVAALSKLPKVGKKTAEQMVLELKGKLVLADEQKPRSTFSARSDIMSALVNLGFKVQDVEKVVDQMDATTEFEEGLRKGLSTLTGNF
jgi:Holliday junction DNA helicase RuvA